jgi:hypothetical protein
MRDWSLYTSVAIPLDVSLFVTGSLTANTSVTLELGGNMTLSSRNGTVSPAIMGPALGADGSLIAAAVLHIAILPGGVAMMETRGAWPCNAALL